MGRGIANAGQATAQGYAAIGQGLSQGIQKYQQKQVEKKKFEGADQLLDNALKNPALAKALNMDPGEDGRFDAGERKAAIDAVGPDAISKWLTEGQKRVAQQDALGKAQAFEQKKLEASITQAGNALGVAQQRADNALTLGTDANDIARIRAETPPAPKSISDTARIEQNMVDALEQEQGSRVTAQQRADISMQVKVAGSYSGDPAANAKVGMLAKTLQSHGEKAQAARMLMPTIADVSQKLADGLKTGAFSPLVTTVKAWASDLGIQVDEDALANAQTAAAGLNQFMLEYLERTSGSVSERENEMFKGMGPEFKKSTEANKALVRLAIERMRLDIDLGNIYDRGMTGDATLGEIQAKINERQLAYDSKYESSLNALFRETVGESYEDYSANQGVLSAADAILAGG